MSILFSYVAVRHISVVQGYFFTELPLSYNNFPSFYVYSYIYN